MLPLKEDRKEYLKVIIRGQKESHLEDLHIRYYNHFAVSLGHEEFSHKNLT